MPDKSTPVEVVDKMIEDMKSLRKFLVDNPQHTMRAEAVGDAEVRVARGFLTLHAQRKA